MVTLFFLTVCSAGNEQAQVLIIKLLEKKNECIITYLYRY